MFGIRSLVVLSLAGALCVSGRAASAQSYGSGYTPGYTPSYTQGYEQFRPSLPPIAAQMGYSDSRAYEGDRRFARQAQARALSSPQVMFAVRWSNPASGNVGETVVAGEGRDSAGHVCRDLRETIQVNGRQIVNTGLACRINGVWRTVG